jgi:spoIIIJ-associated protein
VGRKQGSDLEPDVSLMTNDVSGPVLDFLTRFSAALGVKTAISVEHTPHGPRINIGGEEAELLVRHRGEPLKALQHVVDMAFGRSLPDDQRLFVDALDYRKGKDIELRQMAKLLAEKAQQTGLDQQLGPLNPYERRIVHLAVAEIPGATTESIGDAFSKTVLISARR